MIVSRSIEICCREFSDGFPKSPICPTVKKNCFSTRSHLLPTMARVVLSFGLLAAMANGSFYPEGHFDRVEKVTDYGLFLDYIDEQIEQEKTVFTRFIASES